MKPSTKRSDSFCRLHRYQRKRRLKEFSKKLFENGVFAMALGFPTVPKGKARIRVMISASHSKKDLDQGLEAFGNVGKELGVI
jgi:glycine C-acetyltransferase